MKKWVAVAIGVSILLGCSTAIAQGQEAISKNGQSGPGNVVAIQLTQTEPTMTLNVNFQIFRPYPAGIAEYDMTKVITEISATLYEIVNRECAALSAALKGNCRLVGLNVSGSANAARQARSNGGSGQVSANAQATFEIDAPSASPAPAGEPSAK